MKQGSSSMIQNSSSGSIELGGFLASITISILAYKGFTTITNSGSEIRQPHKNISRSIVISLSICLVLYILVAIAVLGNLSYAEVVKAKDYSLAKAAEPILGQIGVTVTLALAVVATMSGIIASVFAVSRMTAMLVDMELIPFYKIRKEERTQKTTLIYITAIALILTVVFDMTRIASLGAIFYLVMDMMIHYGLIKHLKNEVKVKIPIVTIAFILDGICLIAFIIYKSTTDPLIIAISVVFIVVILLVEKRYLRLKS
jgi:amino acid transporter